MGAVVEKISILVIVYGKNLNKSTTLSSLLKFDCSLFNLVVINNGPEALSDSGDFYDLLNNRFQYFELMNKTENMPLSIAYNRFIEKHPDAQKYVLLDDDSEITESFILRLTDNNALYDLEVPKIVATDNALVSGNIQYPVENDIPVLEMRAVDVKTVFSIGSGLILTRQFVDKFVAARMPIFNNHYALYGVDFSLFRNMRKLVAKGNSFMITSICSINHSLSRLQTGDLSEHTRRERLYDIILSARHYPDKSYAKGLIMSIIRAALSLNASLVFHIILIFITGYHPRCKKHIVDSQK